MDDLGSTFVPWNEHEDTLLKGLARTGVRNDVIAKYIDGRSPAEIAERRSYLHKLAKDDELARLDQRLHSAASRAMSRNPVAAATLLHLLDLKRAGHSPRHTELLIASERPAHSVTRVPDDRSYCGSQGAMCAGA